MAGSTPGNALRTFLSNEITTLFANNYTQSETDYSGTGTIAPPTTAPGFLFIDLSAGVTAPSLFIPDGYGVIKNVNDSSAIIGPNNNDTVTTFLYLGESAGQTFYTGNAGLGIDYVAMTGFGNYVASTAADTGSYVIATGLLSADSAQIAAIPGLDSKGQEQGNTIAAGGGHVSIAAGLGANTIFLGSGVDSVASEGRDTIAGFTGSATIRAGGDGTVVQSDLVFQGAGALTFYGSSDTSGGGSAGTNGSALIVGGTGGGALLAVGGVGPLTVYGGLGLNTLAGGSGGGNLLVAGTGNSTLYGGGANDTLVGAGTADTLVAGSGNETLFGSNTGSDLIFGGNGNDLMVLNGGSDYVQFSTGTNNDTVFTGSGQEIFGYQAGNAGGAHVISGFNAAQDFFSLDSASSATALLATETVSGGNTTFILNGTTSVELLGVTNLTASSFINGMA